MDLLAAAIVVLLLFAASFGGRRAWLAVGSMILSIVLISGTALLIAAPQTGPFLTTLSSSLPSGWDRRAQDLAKILTQAAASLTAKKQASVQPEVHASGGSVSGSVSASVSTSGSAASTAHATGLSFPALDGLMPDLKRLVPTWEESALPQIETEGSGTQARGDAVPVEAKSAVRWVLNEPEGRGQTALLTGINASPDALHEIRAVLRPDQGVSGDADAGVMPLRLIVEGQGTGPASQENADSIPPGARFHLKARAPAASQASLLGGAFVSFAYVQEGRRRTSILYLQPASLAGHSAE